jgi:hypothetical protein
MSDPWEVQEKQAKVYFAQSQIVRTEKHGQSGNTYFEMDIWLTPIETDKQVITRKFRSFNPEWEKITVPSVMKLVQDKRIAKPIEMEQATKLVAYRWTEYRDYTKKSVDYWLAKDPSKILTDELKRNYKTVMGLEFVNVFPTEDEWRQAHEAVSPTIEMSEIPETPFDVPATTDTDPAKIALTAIVTSCGTDMAMLMQRLQYPPLNVYDINSNEVRQAVAQYVATRAGQSGELQTQLLTEINAHFQPETPYMTISSIELVNLLSEVVF